MIPVGWADDGAAVIGGGPEVVGLDGIMYGRPIKKVIREGISSPIQDLFEVDKVKIELRPKTRGIVERVKETARHIRKRYRGTEDCERERERGSVLDSRARAVGSGDHGFVLRRQGRGIRLCRRTSCFISHSQQRWKRIEGINIPEFP